MVFWASAVIIEIDCERLRAVLATGACPVIRACSPLGLMLLDPVLDYFGHGCFSMFGSFIAERLPTAVCRTGQGTSYNVGLMAGAVAPYTIGVVATLPGIGVGLALGITSAFFLLAAGLIFTLPDRSRQMLEAKRLS